MYKISSKKINYYNTELDWIYRLSSIHKHKDRALSRLDFSLDKVILTNQEKDNLQMSVVDLI
jgi:hypothetical protein